MGKPVYFIFLLCLGSWLYVYGHERNFKSIKKIKKIKRRKNLSS